MKKHLMFAIAGVLLAGSALAADDTDRSGVRTSDDPARAAEVERHAEALGFDPNGGAGTSGTSSTAGTMSGHHHAHKPHMGHKAHKSHRGPKAGGAGDTSSGSGSPSGSTQ